MEPVIHQTVNPEYFKIHPHDTSQIVKALYLSSNPAIVPQIITDKPNAIHTSVFKNENTICVFFKEGYHMYVSKFEQFLGMYPNPVATFMLRKSNLINYGDMATDVVCGNAIFFGTQNLKTGQIDNKDHSIPYQIVEESLRIHAIERLY
jgi:hypothetical protein